MFFSAPSTQKQRFLVFITSSYHPAEIPATKPCRISGKYRLILHIFQLAPIFRWHSRCFIYKQQHLMVRCLNNKRIKKYETLKQKNKWFDGSSSWSGRYRDACRRSASNSKTS